MDHDLERVHQRIENAVLRFCQSASEFQVAELLDFVRAQVRPVAPDSAGRILSAVKNSFQRELRQAGKLNHRVISKSESLYQVIHSAPRQTAFDEFLLSREEYPD